MYFCLKDVAANTRKNDKFTENFRKNEELQQKIKLLLHFFFFLILESRTDLGIRLKRKDTVNQQMKSSASPLDRNVPSRY
jgi:hypothetical protein